MGGLIELLMGNSTTLRKLSELVISYILEGESTVANILELFEAEATLLNIMGSAMILGLIWVGIRSA